MAEFYKKYKVVRVLVKLLIVIAIIALAVFLFLRLNPAFGGRASKSDRADYTKRAENYSGGQFVYPEKYELPGLSEDIRVSEKETVPEADLPLEIPDFSEDPAVDEFNVTWFGHSVLFLQMHGMNIMIDPVFSERTSPVSFVGPERYNKLPLQIGELPHIDMVIISHDHYDHLDMNSIKELDSKTDRYIVPLGVENHLERWGVDPNKIYNMAWWEEIDVNGLTVCCTPARHFSNRSIDDSGKTLFASWVFRDDYHQIYESGDSGFGGHFEAIHERYGDFDFVMTDCAQYNIKWHNVHMFPEEAANACEILGAKVVMPIHWGAFVLSSHAWDDPPERFTAAAEEKDIEVVTPKQGETMRLDSYEDYQERWWKNLN